MHRFWDDPLEPATLQRSAVHLEELRAARLKAEEAEECLLRVSDLERDPSPLWSLVVAARMLDYLGMKHLYAQEIAGHFRQLGAHPSKEDVNLFLTFEASFQDHGRVADLMDAISELREQYRARWKDEYTTYRLRTALGWDAEYEYWRRLQAKIAALADRFKDGDNAAGAGVPSAADVVCYLLLMRIPYRRFSRRSFLALASAAPFASAAPPGKRVPLGLELYSVRNELKADLMGTVRAVAKMGYEGVEFYAPYFDWTPAYAKEVRKLLDELGIRCFSTHNSARSFAPENLSRAIDLNQTIGSKIIVMASAGKVENVDGWKAVADRLNQAAEKLKPLGLRAGFHNHETELKPMDDRRPLEVLADNTTKDVVLQLDVGPCIEAGLDPVAWINKNPGRIGSMHVKDWSPDANKGFKVLLGEGAAPWKKIFEAAEKTGGIEYYLIEQEGSDHPPLETVQRCLAAFRKIHTS